MSYGPLKHPRPAHHPLLGPGSLIRRPVRDNLITFYRNTRAAQPLPANLRDYRVELILL